MSDQLNTLCYTLIQIFNQIRATSYTLRQLWSVEELTDITPEEATLNYMKFALTFDEKSLIDYDLAEFIITADSIILMEAPDEFIMEWKMKGWRPATTSSVMMQTGVNNLISRTYKECQLEQP